MTFFSIFSHRMVAGTYLIGFLQLILLCCTLSLRSGSENGGGKGCAGFVAF
jgi:hypothetical protein